MLEFEAAQQLPGESGLLAVDWWNGDRSALVDADLSGLLIGVTLATRPAEIYRALIEATAFGMRIIAENFENHGLAINEIVTCGGLPAKNKMLMQIYADVTGREMKMSAASRNVSTRSSYAGAVAAGAAEGGYDTVADAALKMAHLRQQSFTPNPSAQKVYDQLYREYVTLHSYFGRGGNDVLKRLKQLKIENRSSA